MSASHHFSSIRENKVESTVSGWPGRDVKKEKKKVLEEDSPRDEFYVCHCSICMNLGK